MKTWLSALMAAGCLLLPVLAQHPKQFIQAELVKTVKAKNAKPGDPVAARTAKEVVTPGGVTIPEGTLLRGEVRSASPTSISISFDQAEIGGKQTALPLSIRAAMLPGGPQPREGVVAQTGSVIGMPGVTLQVDESPQHASKFETSGKDLQLKQGLLFMLLAPE